MTKSLKPAARPAVRQAPIPSRWRSRAPILLLIVITLLTFSRTFTAEFTTWDDDVLIYHNPTFNPPTLHSIEVWWTSPDDRLWNPLTETVRGALALVTTDSVDPVTGTRLNPYVFHANNVILHLLTALMVYQVLRLLRFGDWPACAGALLFSVHPIQVEPVAWASALKDTLCGILSLLAIWFFLLANGFSMDDGQPEFNAPLPPIGRGCFAIATSLFVLAMLAKPAAVVLPMVLLALTLVRWTWPPGYVWRQIGLWMLLAIPMLVVTRIVQGAQHYVTVSPVLRPLVAADALAFYLCKLVWPATLTIDYGRRPEWIVQNGFIYWTWLLPAAVAGALLIFRKRARMLLVGGLVFVLSVLPVIGLTEFDFQRFSTVADRYLYLSMLGVAIAVAWIVQYGGRSATILICTALAAFAAKSWAQSAYWHDSESLFTHAVAVNPRSAVSLENLSLCYGAIGDVKTQLSLLNKAIADRPDLPDGYLGLGSAELRAGDKTASADAYRRGFAASPNIVGGKITGYVADFLTQENYDRAIFFARLDVEFRPKSADAWLHLGVALAKSGDNQGAIPPLRKAADLNPSDFHIQSSLATALTEAGDLDEAEQHFFMALAIQPDDPETTKDLAYLKAKRVGAAK